MNYRVQAKGESSRATLSRVARLWLVLLPVAIGLAALTAVQTWLATRKMPEHDSIWVNFLAYVVLVMYWLLIAPLVVYVMRRFPLKRGLFAKHISIHVSAIVGVGAVYVLYLWAANMYVIRFIGTYSFTFVPFFAWLRESGLLAISSAILRYYIPIAAIGYVAFYRDLSKRRELRAANLENELDRARMHVLRIRLQPHFLFNTLNSISELMHTDIKEADRMLVLLGELLRIILQHSEGHEYVPLSIELEHLNKYLEIQKIRFRERLTVHLVVAPECLDCPVPYLLLQPVAENAIKHGVSKRATGGVLSIAASCDRQQLMVTIEDNGPGIYDVNRSGRGLRMGVSHTQARLKQLYGNQADIQMIYSNEGARVVIVIPKKSPTTWT